MTAAEIEGPRGSGLLCSAAMARECTQSLNPRVVYFLKNVASEQWKPVNYWYLRDR